MEYYFDYLVTFIEQYSGYFSLLSVALFSFLVSLPKDLNPLSIVELIFQQIAVKVNLNDRSDSYKRIASLLSLSLVYFPCILIISQLYNIVFKPAILEMLLLFLILSWHDKKLIYEQVIRAIKRNNLAQAKYKLSTLTQRETKPLSLMGVNKACIESMVLQLTASWFAVVFWYLLTGIYGALLYRTIQICAQQWNAKQAEFNALTSIPSFFYAAMLFPVHLIMTVTFALYDKHLTNIIKNCKQSIHWHHFSSGLMLASFALSMQLELGGVRLYQQQKTTYATLGCDGAPNIEQVQQALQRLSLSAWFWLICISSYTFFPLLFELISQHR